MRRNGCLSTTVLDRDPPDPHVFGPPVRAMDPDPDPSISKQKNSKKNLDSYCFVTSFGLFIFENDVVPSKSNKQKNFF